MRSYLQILGGKADQGVVDEERAEEGVEQRLEAREVGMR